MNINELREFPTEKKRKLFTKLKKKVTKVYPRATTSRQLDGRYFVSNGIGGVLGDDLMIPPSKTIWEAWYNAAEYGVKLSRNIRRTHPDKFTGEMVEAKINRINKRRGNRYKS